MDKIIPTALLKIANEINQNNGRAILVGGVVRDLLLDLPLKDFDVEVYGISNFDFLKNILLKYGVVNEVGKAFAVLKFHCSDFEADFAFPRTENKIGKGHKGFEVIADPNLEFNIAALRRDFTINSMGIDLITKEFLDPFNGKIDLLENRILKHVGPKFIEDPLRVFRATQFAARFNLAIDPETIEIARSCDLTELPKERIFEEVKKMFLLSKKPSIGLNYWPLLGITKLFPELETIIGVPEEPLWHPEGDVWTHTLMVVDEMV
ncbi:MAG: CCA tRNA nucleotidyltransferase, partial [Candidatus Margulisiibacteriota bacterium]